MGSFKDGKAYMKQLKCVKYYGPFIELRKVLY